MKGHEPRIARMTDQWSGDERENKKNASLRKKIEKGNLGVWGSEKKCQGTHKKDEKILKNS